MTSACLLDEAMNSNDDVSNDVITISSCEEKRKSWISDDEVSSDVITISSCEEKRKSWISDDDVSNSADGFCDGNNQQIATVVCSSSRKLQYIQSQDTVYPIAGYNVLHIQSTGNSDAGKADVAKSCKPVDKESKLKEVEGNNQTQ
ncbi:folate transporter 1, chloroplastic [Dorcoceras hygrometricum]|uniref:Folate transporter 1, chloroplastic n=1 Tax=Dorcoceras hygrometricum TaxID=472368 RepID=A0A2Z6ZWW3_9LAMI|nr:folate transporter 1, chloroplastic [Dorcoceras hygrometricum]